MSLELRRGVAGLLGLLRCGLLRTLQQIRFCDPQRPGKDLESLQRHVPTSLYSRNDGRVPFAASLGDILLGEVQSVPRLAHVFGENRTNVVWTIGRLAPSHSARSSCHRLVPPCNCSCEHRVSHSQPVARISRHLRAAARALLVTLTLTQLGIAAPPRHFKLRQGDALETLNEYGRQADVQLLFNPVEMKGAKTNAVAGRLEPKQALALLLGGLPVTWKWVDERTVTIMMDPLQEVHTTVPEREGATNSATPDQILVLADKPVEPSPPPLASGLVLRLTRADIDQSGSTTTQDFLHALPQVFGGGPSEDTQLGREAMSNTSKGSGVNLRGLDAGATLILVDGRRLAASGTLGAYSDVSNIPLSAIDHIDILPDGSSTRYGADAVGGVVNIVLRKDFTGSETQLLGGGVTSGTLREEVVSQLFGRHWDWGRGMIGVEYSDRSALPARDRRQETSDLAAFGGNNFDTLYGSPGTIIAGNQTWAIPARGGPLVAGTANDYDSEAGADALPAQRRWSAFGFLGSQVSPNIELSGETLVTRRTMDVTYPSTTALSMVVPATNPFYVNPAGGSAPVTVLTGPQSYFGLPTSRSRVDSGMATTELDITAAHHWTLSTALTLNWETQRQTTAGLWDPDSLSEALQDPDPATAFDPFASGSANNPATLAAIARASSLALSSHAVIASLNADGPLMHLAGGDAKGLFGVEFRDERLDSSSETPLSSPSDSQSRLGRRVSSAFSELTIPLVGGDHSRAGMRKLELSVAGRYESYSDVGGASVPNMGLAWMPLSSLVLRGTWSKSFKAPNLPDQDGANSFSELSVVASPQNPAQTATVLEALGSNPRLAPERAESWAFGAEFAPAERAGLSLTANFFHVSFWDRIAASEIDPYVLEEPTLAYLTIRNFTAAERESLCTETRFLGTRADCLNAPITAIVDDRLQNLQTLTTSGVDVIGKYATSIGRTSLTFGVNGTYLLSYAAVQTPGTPVMSLLNTQNNPLNMRVRGSLSWGERGLTAAAFINYSSSYRDIASVPPRPVGSWTTIDLRLAYGDFRAGPLRGLQLAVTAENLFNHDPPFLNNRLGVGYDQENADVIGRVLTAQLRQQW